MTWASKAQQYAAREIEVYDSMPLLTRCALCEWSHEGTAASGREEAIQHRLQAHPEVKRSRRKNSHHLARFRQPHLSDEEVSEIDRNRHLRARLIGIELD